MFIKWLVRQLCFAAIGGLAFWYISFHTADRTTGINLINQGVPNMSGIGNTMMLLFGFALTIFGYFTKRKDGSSIGGLGMLIMLGATYMVWG